MCVGILRVASVKISTLFFIMASCLFLHLMHLDEKWLLFFGGFLRFFA